MGYIYVWEHSGGGRHIDADQRLNFEDLYNPELDLRIFVWQVCFLLVSQDFSDAPTTFIVHLRLPLSVESCESLHHRKPLGMSRQYMCGGDDHLVWKRSVFSEACRGLRSVRWYDRFCQGSFKVHPYPFRATLTLQDELRSFDQDSFLTRGCI